MDGLLTAVQTKGVDDASKFAKTSGISSAEEASSSATDNNPEALLQLLQQEPTKHELYRILKCLDPARSADEKASFDIRLAGPVSGQILQILVKKTIPDHWRNVERSSPKIRGVLLRCVSSIVGLRALIGYLQILINTIRSATVKEQESGNILALRDLLSFTSALLKPSGFVSRVYNDNLIVYNTSTKRHVVWTEFCSLLSGGKLVSTAAEGLSLIGDSKDIHTKSWIGEGCAFAEWLGKNLSYMIVQSNTSDEDFSKSASLMIGRAVGLGYTDQFVHELYTGVIVDSAVSPSWSLYFQHLRQHERSAIFHSMLKDIQKRYFAMDERKHEEIASIAGGTATLLSEFLKGIYSSQEMLRYWLSLGNNNVVTTFGLRRALVLLVINDTGISTIPFKYETSLTNSRFSKGTSISSFS
jgi:telomere length regulation protein